MKGQYQQIQTALGNSNKRHLSHSAGCYLVTYPVNIRLDEDVLKTSFVFVFRRRLQDVLIKTNMFALALRLQDVFKTSWSRPIYLSWPYVFKMSSRHFQDIFKTSCKNVLKTSSIRLKKRLQDIFKTSSRRFEDVFSTSCKDILKTFSRRIIKLNCSC